MESVVDTKETEILSGYERRLAKAMAVENDRSAHERAIPVLHSMVSDSRVLHEILKNSILSRDLFTNQRLGLTTALSVFDGNGYTLRANCFFPLPNRVENVADNWIHHHDVRRLTTVNAFGEQGYKSILFNREIAKASNSAKYYLDIESEFRHGLGNHQTIEPFVPHVVFIPPEMTITYALWSVKPERVTAEIKKAAPVKLVRKVVGRNLRNTAEFVGAGKLLDLMYDKHCHSRQFAPNGDHFKLVGNVKNERATNEEYTRNLFFMLQQVGFDDEEVMLRVINDAKEQNRADVVQLAKKILNRSPITDSFDISLLNHSEINFTRDQILAVC